MLIKEFNFLFIIFLNEISMLLAQYGGISISQQYSSSYHMPSPPYGFYNSGGNKNNVVGINTGYGTGHGEAVVNFENFITDPPDDLDNFSLSRTRKPNAFVESYTPQSVTYEPKNRNTQRTNSNPKGGTRINFNKPQIPAHIPSLPKISSTSPRNFNNEFKNKVNKYTSKNDKISDLTSNRNRPNVHVGSITSPKFVNLVYPSLTRHQNQNQVDPSDIDAPQNNADLHLSEPLPSHQNVISSKIIGNDLEPLKFKTDGNLDKNKRNQTVDKNSQLLVVVPNPLHMQHRVPSPFGFENSDELDTSTRAYTLHKNSNLHSILPNTHALSLTQHHVSSSDTKENFSPNFENQAPHKNSGFHTTTHTLPSTQQQRVSSFDFSDELDNQRNLSQNLKNNAPHEKSNFYSALPGTHALPPTQHRVLPSDFSDELDDKENLSQTFENNALQKNANSQAITPPNALPAQQLAVPTPFTNEDNHNNALLPNQKLVSKNKSDSKKTNLHPQIPNSHAHRLTQHQIAPSDSTELDDDDGGHSNSNTNSDNKNANKTLHKNSNSREHIPNAPSLHPTQHQIAPSDFSDLYDDDRDNNDKNAGTQVPHNNFKSQSHIPNARTHPGQKNLLPSLIDHEGIDEGDSFPPFENINPNDETFHPHTSQSLTPISPNAHPLPHQLNVPPSLSVNEFETFDDDDCAPGKTCNKSQPKVFRPDFIHDREHYQKTKTLPNTPHSPNARPTVENQYSVQQKVVLPSKFVQEREDEDDFYSDTDPVPFETDDLGKKKENIPRTNSRPNSQVPFAQSKQLPPHTRPQPLSVANPRQNVVLASEFLHEKEELDDDYADPTVITENSDRTKFTKLSKKYLLAMKCKNYYKKHNLPEPTGFDTIGPGFTKEADLHGFGAQPSSETLDKSNHLSSQHQNVDDNNHVTLTQDIDDVKLEKICTKLAKNPGAPIDDIYEDAFVEGTPKEAQHEETPIISTGNKNVDDGDYDVEDSDGKDYVDQGLKPEHKKINPESNRVFPKVISGNTVAPVLIDHDLTAPPVVSNHIPAAPAPAVIPNHVHISPARHNQPAQTFPSNNGQQSCCSCCNQNPRSFNYPSPQGPYSCSCSNGCNYGHSCACSCQPQINIRISCGQNNGGGGCYGGGNGCGGNGCGNIGCGGSNYGCAAPSPIRYRCSCTTYMCTCVPITCNSFSSCGYTNGCGGGGGQPEIRVIICCKPGHVHANKVEQCNKKCCDYSKCPIVRNRTPF